MQIAKDEIKRISITIPGIITEIFVLQFIS